MTWLWNIRSSAKIAAFVFAAGCATTSVYQTPSIEDLGILDRAVIRSEGEIDVTVAVPSPDEARNLFGFKIDKKHIQPIWIEIVNKSDRDHWFLSHSLDPDYFSAMEVAWIGRSKYTKAARREMESAIHQQAMRFHVPAGSTTSGYVFANQQLGARRVMVELVSEGWRAGLDRSDGRGPGPVDRL